MDTAFPELHRRTSNHTFSPPPPPADEAYWAAASSLRASLAAAGSALVVRSGRTEEELSKLAAAVGARTIFAEEEARKLPLPSAPLTRFFLAQRPAPAVGDSLCSIPPCSSALAFASSWCVFAGRARVEDGPGLGDRLACHLGRECLSVEAAAVGVGRGQLQLVRAATERELSLLV